MLFIGPLALLGAIPTAAILITLLVAALFGVAGWWWSVGPSRLLARRARRHQCTACGEDLSDAAAALCPRCGAPNCITHATNP